MADRHAGAILFSTRMDRLAAFYEAVTGLERTGGADDHHVLESPGFTLVIHGIPEAIAASISVSNPPAVRIQSPTKLCLPVSDLGAARDRAGPLGGQVYGAERTWTWGDVLVCDGHDPDGNVFQLWQTVSQ